LTEVPFFRIIVLLKVEEANMIQENLKKFMVLAAASGYPVNEPTVTVTNLGKAAGRCSSEGIFLDAQYLAEYGEEVSFHTLGHEFAHWIQFQHNLFTRSKRGWEVHDATFKALCRMLGVKDGTFHNMKVEGKNRLKRHALVCPTCSKEYQVTKIIINRMVKGTKGYQCHCGQPLSAANVLE
jgi:predicted SprT family Zn-dependent metalloprotease